MRLLTLMLMFPATLFTFGGEPNTTLLDSRGEALKELAWLAGSWSGERNGVLSEEHWLHPAGGVMIGIHRDYSPSGRVFFEFLRIVQREDGIFYLASPMGKEPTSFKLVQVTEKSVVFENPEHDFPKQIKYELDEAGNLVATVSGDNNGQPRQAQWVWAPARLR